MPKYTLTYFNGRGRAETARLILAAAQVDYHDNRIDADDWTQLKETTPFGHLPVFHVNQKALGQSVAICRFLAREYDLAGRNQWDQALVDSVVDTITEMRETGFSAFQEKDEEKKVEMLQQFTDTTLPALLQLLDNFLAANGEEKEWFVGSQMTWADLHFYACSENIMGLSDDLFADYPRLQALFDRVADSPQVAKYLEERPQTEF